MNILENIHNRNYLTHALHLQCSIEMKGLLEMFDPDVLKIAPQFYIFKMSVELEDLCYKIIRKSDLSEVKKDADYDRDDTLVGLGGAINTAAHHFDPEIKKAGKRIKIVFDEYNRPKPMRMLPYDAETVSIENFIQEMNSKYAKDMETTSLTPWINKLAAENAEFDRQVKAYIKQQAEKPSFRMKDVRQETDKACKDIVSILNADIIRYGESDYATFIAEWNTLIKHYNDLLAQHKGRNKAKKEKAKKEKEKKEQEEKVQEEKVQGTENKEQSTENKVQGTENKEQSTENKEQGTENKGQSTDEKNN
jgi:hypothetical protein